MFVNHSMKSVSEETICMNTIENQDRYDGEKLSGSLRTYLHGWLRRFLVLLAPAFLCVFTLILFGPLDIMNSNRMYLTFKASSFIGSLSLVTIAATIVIAAALALVPGRFKGVAVAVLVAIGLMFYLQGGLLNGDIGILDGSSFDWHDIPQQAYRNIAIWAAVIIVLGVIGGFFPEQTKTIGTIVALSLVVAQTLPLALTWVEEKDDTPNWQLDGVDELHFSTGDNIIVLTLDQLNPLIFDKIRGAANGIYVAPRTRIITHEDKIVRPEQLRVARRLIRDYNTRGHSLRETVERARSVDQGEVTLDNRKDRVLGNMIICLPNQVMLQLFTPEEVVENFGDQQ